MAARELLVEGTDDQHVMWALFETHAVPQVFDVVRPKDRKGEPAGGVEQLLASLPTRLKQSDLQRLGVVVDADEHVQSRWDAIRGILEAGGCADVPPAPRPEGTVVQIPDGPRVGVWVMPDNVVPGILESFLAFLAPHADPLLAHVHRFIDTIPPDCGRCPGGRLPKARIHAWLSVQNEPGKPLGQAITAKYLDATVSHVGPFLSWVRALLVD